MTIAGGHSLVPGFEMRIFDQVAPEGSFIRFESSLTIGSAMGQKLQRAFDAHRRGPPLTISEARLFHTRRLGEPFNRKVSGQKSRAATSNAIGWHQH